MQFDHTNSNSGDMNNADPRRGTLVQSVGDGNEVQADQPRENFWVAPWKEIKAGWKGIAG
jgi:hypothetical protein